jgi:hypothetical protein
MRQLSCYERQTRTTPKQLSVTLPGLATVTLALSRSLAPRVLDLVFVDVCRMAPFLLLSVVQSSVNNHFRR